MSERDYLADAHIENLILRTRIVELEEELDRLREELRVAHERKIEEVSVSSDFHPGGIDGNRHAFAAPERGIQTDEGVPPEETAHQNRPKKEETTGSGLSAGGVKHEAKLKVEHRVAPKKPVGTTPEPECKSLTATSRNSSMT